MKSKKLSQEEKSFLRRSLLNKAFEKEESKLEKKESLIAESLYKLFVDPHIEALKKLPERWLKMKDSIDFSFKDGRWRCFGLKSGKLMPSLASSRDIVPFIAVEDYPDISKEIEQFDNQSSKLKERKNALDAKIKASLNACNTTKQLKEAWPEAYDVYADLYPDRAEVYLPAIPREDLNKEIGLP